MTNQRKTQDVLRSRCSLVTKLTACTCQLFFSPSSIVSCITEMYQIKMKTFNPILVLVYWVVSQTVMMQVKDWNMTSQQETDGLEWRNGIGGQYLNNIIIKMANTYFLSFGVPFDTILHLIQCFLGVHGQIPPEFSGLWMRPPKQVLCNKNFIPFWLNDFVKETKLYLENVWTLQDVDLSNHYYFHCSILCYRYL